MIRKLLQVLHPWNCGYHEWTENRRKSPRLVRVRSINVDKTVVERKTVFTCKREGCHATKTEWIIKRRDSNINRLLDRKFREYL